MNWLDPNASDLVLRFAVFCCAMGAVGAVFALVLCIALGFGKARRAYIAWHADRQLLAEIRNRRAWRAYRRQAYLPEDHIR